jgi:chorismate mutase/prephenate dehydratase
MGIKIAFQGERGAFSESAVYSYFGHSAEANPCWDLSDVFESVQNGKTKYGVVPVENSLEGSVNQTYDLFLKHNVMVSGEIVLRIVHCLIAHPCATLSSVKAVYSHPVALAQCRAFLGKLGVKLVPSVDTAGSVAAIKKGGVKDGAAVASERAAEIYKMKILAKGIEDNESNHTRFFVLSKHDVPRSAGDKTSIIFAANNVPGSLFRVLEQFAVRDINLTRIESRPTREKPWEYYFYLDFKGHRKDLKCKEALESIRDRTRFLKVLGSYKAAEGWF